MSQHWADRSSKSTEVSVDRLPVILVVLSLFLLLSFQTYQAIRDQSALSNLRASQEQMVQESLKLRHQLELLAGDTAQLAAGGDAGAQAIVDQMKKQGISLNPPQRDAK